MGLGVIVTFLDSGFGIGFNRFKTSNQSAVYESSRRHQLSVLPEHSFCASLMTSIPSVHRRTYGRQPCILCLPDDSADGCK